MKSRKLSVCGVLVLALLVLGMPASVAAQNTTMQVGPGQQFTTIQDAVDAASPGSTILVYPKPGDYQELVKVTKNNLTFLAQGGKVTVRPPDLMPDQEVQDSLPGGFLVHADGVTIQGFDIGFGGHCVPGITFKGSHNRFANNYIYQYYSCPGVNAFIGIDDSGSSHYNTIERNTLHHADYGLVLQSWTPDHFNRGDIIRDNVFEQIATTPIAILNGDGFLVSGNSIDGTNYEEGGCINIGTTGGNTLPQGHHQILKNTIKNCKSRGIWLYAFRNDVTDKGDVLTGNRVAQNTIKGCKETCIMLQTDAKTTLSDNEISLNTLSPTNPPTDTEPGMISDGEGIRLQVGFDAHVNNNIFQGNVARLGGIGIDLAAGAEGNQFVKNLVQDNISYGIQVAGNNNFFVNNTVTNNGIPTGGLDIFDNGQGNRWVNNTYGTKNQ
jgi:parallel beta-helix repeat protein